MRNADRKLAQLGLALALTVSGAPGWAQFVDDSRDDYAFDSPEGWAMGWVTASTLLTAFGETPRLAAGDLRYGAELGSIPWLDESQQQVGFGGSKAEDLNKSPAFGRVHTWVGLPRGLVLELAWTPPVRIDGAKPQDLFAAAIGKQVWERERWSLSLRAFGQIGQVRGDVTCPRSIAGNEDPNVNPFRCLEPSDDRVDLRYHGLDTTLGFGGADTRGHFTFGVARMEPEVQVNARSRNLRSIPQLFTRGSAPYVALGVTHDWMARWQIASELLWVPLDVRRDEDGPVERDAFWSFRLALRLRPQS